MGSSASNRKSGTPDRQPRTPSVAKKLTEYLRTKGIPQDPMKPLDFRRAGTKKNPKKTDTED